MQTQKQRKKCLFIGNTGAGKTTLYNILCNKKLKTGSSRNFITDKLF